MYGLVPAIEKVAGALESIGKAIAQHAEPSTLYETYIEAINAIEKGQLDDELEDFEAAINRRYAALNPANLYK